MNAEEIARSKPSKQFSKEETDKIFKISCQLIDLFGYSDDEDYKHNYDNFIEFVMDDIVINMKSMKERYYHFYNRISKE